MNNKFIGIAINDYQDSNFSNLNNCLNDLFAIRDVLTEKYNFQDVEVLTNKDQTLRSFIYNRLYDIFINAIEDDNIILFYAGHGEHNPIIGTSYWLTSDSRQDDTSTWLNLNDILLFMKASKAKHIGLISDSCFSGTIFEGAMRGGGLSAIENRKSRFALTSGSKERVSDGKVDSLSPFTETLIKTLRNNELKEYLFTTFSENTIINFASSTSQTPRYGSLANAGHEGGVFVFRLKTTNELYQDMSLALNINSVNDLDYNCTIPFFHDNLSFDSNFINSFILNIGYSIINDARSFFLEENLYFRERSKEDSFFLDIGYNISLINSSFLSLTISRFDYYGGAHPNNYIYSLNFVFKPDRRINLYELIDYTEFDNFESFILHNIERYSDKESQDVLKDYIQSIDPYTIDFSINEKELIIYFMNVMPRVVMALGFLEIPIDDLKFKISGFLPVDTDLSNNPN